MRDSKFLGPVAAGLAAGAVNGLFGGGGGMVLIPLLSLWTAIRDDALFPTSVAVMAPVSAASLWFSGGPLPWSDALPYLIGGAAGGLAAGLWGSRIPTKWLHRIFGALLVFGGVRYLC